jgi:hypothetical protein
MYKSRDITNFKTATTALDLLTSNNDFNKFQQVFTTIIKLTTNTTDKTIVTKDIKQQNHELLIDESIQTTEHVALKPHVNFVKNNKTKYAEHETIMPSYAIINNRKYTEFSKVWNECNILLYRNSRAYMEQQQKPVKLRLGVELTIFRHKSV